MLIRYARVSSKDQNIELQTNELKKDGCSKIFSDKVSGTNKKRLGLEDALSHLRQDDTLIIWKLDRLGRRLKSLIEAAKKLLAEEMPPRDVTENLSVSIPTLYRRCPVSDRS